MHRGQRLFLFQAATAQGVRGTGELRGAGREEGRAGLLAPEATGPLGLTVECLVSCGGRIPETH